MRPGDVLESSTYRDPAWLPARRMARLPTKVGEPSDCLAKGRVLVGDRRGALGVPALQQNERAERFWLRTFANVSWRRHVRRKRRPISRSLLLNSRILPPLSDVQKRGSIPGASTMFDRENRSSASPVDRTLDQTGPGDVVEAALASALMSAVEAGRFDVVAQLARELEARRLLTAASAGERGRSS